MSHIDATMARIQEIEARLLGYQDPENFAPSTARLSRAASQVQGTGASTPQSRMPFPIALGKATGQISIQKMAEGNGGAPLSPYIEGLINRYSAQNGLSPNLVRAVIHQESDGNPKDTSNKGAMGLMQLMPEDVKEYGITNAYDEEQNIRVGTQILGKLVKQYQGNLPLALAAYNAGAGAVAKYNGIPPYSETQNYVHKIMQSLGMNDKE